MKSTDKNKITEEEIKDAICQVESDREILEAFKSVSQRDLRVILQQERNKKTKAKTLQIWLYSVSSIAASLFVVLMLTVFKKDSSQNQILYATCFDMPEYKQVTSRGVSEIDSIFFDFYNKEQYEDALNVIKSLSEDDLTDEPELKFYAAVSYMRTRDMQQAIKYLSELYNNELGGQEVQWYLALSYLYENQTNKSKVLLQKIDDGGYTGRAKDLLEKLK